MSKSNSNKIPPYNFAHISSYVNGKMSREEMYAFEKAMQADPFLEDAVEGFREANIKKAEADVTAIKAALLPEKESAKIFPFHTLYKNWFSAAAVIIVIGTIGAVTFAILKPNNTNQQVAIVTPATEKPKALVDTIHSISNSPTAANGKPTPSFTLTTRQPVIVADKVVSASLTQQETISSLQDDQVRKLDSTHFYNNTSIAKLSDKEINGLPPNNIDTTLKGKMSDSKKETVHTDLSKQMVAVNGYLDTHQIINALTKDTTQTAKNTLNDVVIIGYGSAKRKEVAGRVGKITIDPLDSLMPVGGWQYYSKYMNQKIGFIGDTISNNSLVITDRNGNTLDDIEIEFSVDKNGSAYNVKVINDIDSTQAKTIANAVVEGPKWMSRKKKNKAKIPLKFP
ncbi:hypothetical protein ACFOW1_02950 [Parasediminibacterium paludis]|uniref:TonB-like protein n=1 Tax=Parasediminibacterium paludis TaxID=908966 RepID=A0ABV8PRQ2_9BACT